MFAKTLAVPCISDNRKADLLAGRAKCWRMLAEVKKKQKLDIEEEQQSQHTHVYWHEQSGRWRAMVGYSGKSSRKRKHEHFDEKDYKKAVARAAEAHGATPKQLLKKISNS